MAASAAFTLIKISVLLSERSEQALRLLCPLNTDRFNDVASFSQPSGIGNNYRQPSYIKR